MGRGHGQGHGQGQGQGQARTEALPLRHDMLAALATAQQRGLVGVCAPSASTPGTIYCALGAKKE